MKIVQSKILEVIFFRQFVPFCLHNFGAQNKGAQQRCQLQQDIEQREKSLSCVVIDEKEDQFAHDAKAQTTLPAARNSPR